ncbi:hypothetical protein HOG21_01925 [bacterium]|nr:hypothetical protein [bacterium]
MSEFAFNSFTGVFDFFKSQLDKRRLFILVIFLDNLSLLLSINSDDISRICWFER